MLLPCFYQDQRRRRIIPRNRMGESAATKTQHLFLVGLLLIAVLMTVRNIQGTVESLPAEIGETGHHEEAFIAETSPILLSPSTSKSDFQVSEQQERLHVSASNELKSSEDQDHRVNHRLSPFDKKPPTAIIPWLRSFLWDDWWKSICWNDVSDRSASEEPLMVTLWYLRMKLACKPINAV